MKASILSAVLALLAVPGFVRAACDDAEYRQFDFWIGSWNVYTPSGKLAGHNRIEPAYDGCVLRETYSNPKGYRGESLNAYDRGRRVWHQTWVDNSGRLLLLEGGLSGAAMVLEGDVANAKGRLERHRITWTPDPDGSVRQHWQSRDGEGTWTTVFDGVYRRAE